MYLKNTPFSSKNLYLDSKNAIKEQNTYRFDLNTSITRPPGSRMILAVKECQFPNIFPNIRSGINNTFSIQGTISGLNSYTIPEGYYDITQYATIIKSLCGLVVTYSSQKQLIFTSLIEDFTFISTADYLGSSGSPSSTFGILTMNYVMDFSGLDYVFIKSNLILRNINNKGETSNTLVRVPISLPWGYSILYTQSNPTNHLTHEQSISTIQLQITDKEERSLNLQNLNFQVVIEVSYIYPEEVRLFNYQRPVHPLENENLNN